MAKLFQINYDASASEIETAYDAFQNKYMLRKKILYTIVYLIVLVLGVDLIIKNSSSPAGYIASGLSAGILLFNWIKPLMIKKKLVQTLSELNDETYSAAFYDDKIVIETIIDSSAETETIAITQSGVYTVEEGSEAEKELLRNPVPAEEIQKTVYNLSETDIFFAEKNEVFMLFINRSYIHTIPARCLSAEEREKLRNYFSEKGPD